MKANLYLLTDNLNYNGIDSKEVVLQKITHLVQDLATVKASHKEDNIIWTSQNIAEWTPFEKVSLFEFLNNENIPSDIKGFLYCCLYDSAHMTALTKEEVDTMSYHKQDEKECHAACILNYAPNNDDSDQIKETEVRDEEKEGNNKECDKWNSTYMQFDKYEVVYNLASWLTLRRQILGNHPGNPHSFMEECQYCFPNLVFSDNCENQIDETLDLAPRQIVYYLACTNDRFIEFTNKFDDNKQLNDLLAEFAGQYGFYKAGSIQGDPKDKEAYSFPYKDKTIKCEAHWKIQQTDDNCRVPHYENGTKIRKRIYFNHNSKVVGQPNKIFIGSIGPHA